MTSQCEMQFPFTTKKEIHDWAKCYTDVQTGAERLVEQYFMALKDTVQARGYLLYNEFYDLYYWKLKRKPRSIKKNSESYIEKVTGKAFCLDDDWEKLKKLTDIYDVGGVVASAILHFYDRSKSPILDQHALRSVRICEKYVYGPQYPFWQEYVDFCCEKAECYEVSMRTLDRALWKYSESGVASEDEHPS
jgi:hypothetical protein